jgi:hypothetical protein
MRRWAEPGGFVDGIDVLVSGILVSLLVPSCNWMLWYGGDRFHAADEYCVFMASLSVVLCVENGNFLLRVKCPYFADACIVREANDYRARFHNIL